MDLTTALECAPDKIKDKIFISLGNLAQNNDHPKLALEMHTESFMLNPYSTDALVAMGTANIKLRRYSNVLRISTSNTYLVFQATQNFNMAEKLNPAIAMHASVIKGRYFLEERKWKYIIEPQQEGLIGQLKIPIKLRYRKPKYLNSLNYFYSRVHWDILGLE